MMSLRFWKCCSLILGTKGNDGLSLLAKSENPEEREKLNDERDGDEKGERKPREREGQCRLWLVTALAERVLEFRGNGFSFFLK